MSTTAEDQEDVIDLHEDDDVIDLDDAEPPRLVSAPPDVVVEQMPPASNAKRGRLSRAEQRNKIPRAFETLNRHIWYDQMKKNKERRVYTVVEHKVMIDPFFTRREEVEALTSSGSSSTTSSSAAAATTIDAVQETVHTQIGSAKKRATPASTTSTTASKKTKTRTKKKEEAEDASSTPVDVLVPKHSKVVGRDYHTEHFPTPMVRISLFSPSTFAASTSTTTTTTLLK